MGYEGRYTLPGQRAELQEYLQPEIDRQNAENQVQEMVSIVYRALNLGLGGAQQLSDRVFFLQDNPETDEREQIVAEYNQFVEDHPEVLQEPEEDNQLDD